MHILRTKQLTSLFIIILFSINAFEAYGAAYSYKSASKKKIPKVDLHAKTVIGIERVYRVIGKETLMEVARYYDLGYDEIVKANPTVDPWIPEPGSKLVIPTTWVLPYAPYKDIVINLAEMRLYYFMRKGKKRIVKTFPLGIGREGFNSPLGSFRIIGIRKNPSWYVPASIRKEQPDLPKVVPPGPENPLGDYWFQLSITGYGIHGTNKPYGVGRRVSHGCIRMYPEDVKNLARFVRAGTRVRIVNQPIKVGIRYGEVYIEIETDKSVKYNQSSLMSQAYQLLKQKKVLHAVDSKLLREAVKAANGIPNAISRKKPVFFHES